MKDKDSSDPAAPAPNGPVSLSRLRKLDDGRSEYSLKEGVAFTSTAEALVKRFVALTPLPNRHLSSFHGIYAPNAELRPLVLTPRTRPAEESPPPPPPGRTTAPPPHLDWAALHQRTFGKDVLQCPCGGRRTVRRPPQLARHAQGVCGRRETLRPPRPVLADRRALVLHFASNRSSASEPVQRFSGLLFLSLRETHDFLRSMDTALAASDNEPLNID